jgi:hypothetical protein
MKKRTDAHGLFPLVMNYRGKPVGAWLGGAIFGAMALWVALWILIDGVIAGSPGRAERVALWALAGSGIVFLAGLYDDHRPARTRGVMRQIRALAAGAISPGIVKMAAITGAAALVAWMLGARGAKLGLGVPVMAGSANLWNLFDVIPGRSLKFFLPAAAGLLAAGPGGYALLAAPALVAGCVALPLDLSEAAMLGDAGSNVLGFVVGVGLLEGLGVPGLAVALGVIVALHALSESVTLSRAIQSVPPLRWFDRAGRVRVDEGSGYRGGIR